MRAWRIDEARAEELYRNLGGLEKFGVWRSGVEQKKRDKNEMMARLQRKHDNQLHNLTPAERARSYWCEVFDYLPSHVFPRTANKASFTSAAVKLRRATSSTMPRWL